MQKCWFLIFLLLAGRLAVAQDTVRHVHHRADSAFFSEGNIPQRNDYLESFERVFQTLNKVPLLTSSFLNLDNISADLPQNDAALGILKERLSHDYHSLNIRSLQVYNTLLDKLDATTNGYVENLDSYNGKLEDLKKEILGLKKDTLIGHIFRDTALRSSFATQLQQLRGKWRRADSLLRSSTTVVNSLRAHAAANAITIAELLYQVDGAIDDLADSVFGKEQPYLWEDSAAVTADAGINAHKGLTAGEIKLAHYYFADASSIRFWILISWAVFFYWVWFNFRSLKRLDKLSAVNDFNILYIKPVPVIASLIFILNLAPLFDQHAPAVYIESTQFLLMLLLAIVFYHKLPVRFFSLWILLIALALFLYLAGPRHLFPPYAGRWITLVLDIASAAVAVYFFFMPKEREQRTWFVQLAVGLYLILHLVAAYCNLFGRVTLSQLAGITAIFALSQTIALAIFVQVATEAFLLQVQSSRMRKKYPEPFEFHGIARSIRRFLIILAIFLWLMVLATNLNIYDALNDKLTELFTTQRHVGNFTITLSGIVLFLGIIWIANFLQKYIAYFFGDTGDDASMDDKGQRSRLLVTRLILLLAGFLIAVAASGLPVDKITFILGALGVGIGLGLQGIVNNFVSGIIIIFDRPMRIGDTVEIGDKRGRVKEIGIRSSTLLTEEGAEVIIPNGDVLSHNIVNWTLSNNQVRSALSFNLDKAAYTDAVQPEIKELIKAIPKIFLRREPDVVMENITSKSVGMKVYFWCTDITSASATTAQVREAIYNYLDKKGITVL